MGRRRTFIESEAIGSATAVFAERGFAGASVDDLVRATGVNRASLYGVFGSKDGLFQRCLTEALAALSPADTSGSPADAAEAGQVELLASRLGGVGGIPGDAAVREALEVALDRAEITAEALGRRLLERAGAATSSSASSAPTASASPPT